MIEHIEGNQTGKETDEYKRPQKNLIGLKYLSWKTFFKKKKTREIFFLFVRVTATNQQGNWKIISHNMSLVCY